MTEDGVATAEDARGSDDDAGPRRSDGRTYGGLLTAFPYAVRESDSRLFKLYGTVSGLLSTLLAFFFAAAVTVAVSNTLGAGGGTFTFVRSFYVFVALAVVSPIVAPVLFVAREHRRGRGDARFDRRMALLGFVYFVALYVAAVISMPPEFTLDGEVTTRPDPSGLFAPLIRVFYLMPPLSSILPPALVGVAMYLLDRKHKTSNA